VVQHYRRQVARLVDWRHRSGKASTGRPYEADRANVWMMAHGPNSVTNDFSRSPTWTVPPLRRVANAAAKRSVSPRVLAPGQGWVWALTGFARVP
jgi:hypothetical protein